MRLERAVSTSQPVNVLKAILSDPAFILPVVFRSTQNYEIHGNSFNITARHLLFKHKVYGNVYSLSNEIVYFFTLVFGNQLGSGRLKFRVTGGAVNVYVEYKGWMEVYSRILFMQWIDEFCTNFDKIIHEERIRRGL
ncbi:STK_08120 family protein [Metallosphaera javensis (ex Hofmann et al. 2022)]|uniref:STK_08120 family protein n=1 Tax=Metallosphaera javensis (ex Hofmann et al. 2022) TaxID=99938 RepID=UPI001EDFE291|nr:STK_08120 family protein [Metallosphaera javensis (ex Hofmann et al. 2022)]